MGQRVNVTSVEAIESFRASLIIYISKARATLDEGTSEVVRTRNWVEVNQRVHWEEVARRRRRELDEAKEALLSSKMSNLRKVSNAEQMALAKAKRALEEAEAKLKILRRWDRDFETVTGPPARQMEKLHSLLATDMVMAVEYLTNVLKSLEAYASIRAPGVEPGAGQTNAGEKTGSTGTTGADSTAVPKGTDS